MKTKMRIFKSIQTKLFNKINNIIIEITIIHNEINSFVWIDLNICFLFFIYYSNFLVGKELNFGTAKFHEKSGVYI